MTSIRKLLTRVDSYKLARKNIINLYKTNSGKKFIHHLIYSFSDPNTRLILFTKKEVYDCLSGSKLNTVYSKRSDITDELSLELLNSINRSLSSEEISNITKKLNDRTLEIIKDNPVERLAIKSIISDKILGLDELQALIDFTRDQYISGDEVIVKMTRYASRNSTNKRSKVDYRKTIGADDSIRLKLSKLVNNG